MRRLGLISRPSAALLHFLFVAVLSGLVASSSDGMDAEVLHRPAAIPRALEEFQPDVQMIICTKTGIFESWGPNVQVGSEVQEGGTLALLRTAEGNSVMISPYHGQVVAMMGSLNHSDVVYEGDNMVQMRVYKAEAQTTPAPVIVYKESGPSWETWGRMLLILFWLCVVGGLIVMCLLCINKAVAGEGPETANRIFGSLVEKQPLLRRFSQSTHTLEGDGVPIEFTTTTSYWAAPVVVNCEYKPLGIVFPRKLPLTVEGFRYNSYAKSMGVHPGWKLSRIAGQDVSREMSFERVEGMLLDALASLPQWPLRIVFRDADGQTVPIQMQYKPLGISFIKQTPIVVDEFAFNSYAYEAGVQSGWEILAIGEEDVRDERVDVVEQVLQDSLAALPLWPLRIDFNAGGEDEITKYFDYHPVGFSITKHGLIDKVEAGGQADALEIEQGWSVVRIGTAEVKSHKLKELKDMLDEGTQHLPDYGPTE
eukprot:CAMPEP_0178395624 /NCGR_PEP_ID=MMETSP0689_2-20121128/13315_1 /TAXON_ID=160604 /ORGANISM="Amphidinium massartii, Strain CS-259" /LENGTH=479 /DNA_ID=CAMNT_0020016285 /DNA_START=15 /DNA_END=1454 /DNA_ORIENTATION=+